MVLNFDILPERCHSANSTPRLSYRVEGDFLGDMK